jgi:hypothetical protein
MTGTIERNNSVGSLLKPLLKKVTLVVGSRMLCVKFAQNIVGIASFHYHM